MSNEPNTDHIREGKYRQHVQTFDPLCVIHLHKCNLFDMLRSDGGQSQSAASKTSTSIDNGIEKATLVFIPIPACDIWTDYVQCMEEGQQPITDVR